VSGSPGTHTARGSPGAHAPRGFTIAHVSDLHVSTFGDTFHDRARIIKRSARIAETTPEKWETYWEEAGWRVLHQKGARRAKLELVDPDGYAHPIPSVKRSGGLIDPVERAAAHACRLEARRAVTLAKGLPTPAALETLEAPTPKNSNLRLLRAVRSLSPGEIDAVVITGDLTDDGDGWELVEAAFEPWRARGRLYAVPGNHDLYLFPLAGSGRPRPTHESKRRAWRAFAERIGLRLDPTGGWTAEIPEAEAILVGLDSCARPQRRFFRHNGAIGEAQLEYFRRTARRPEWKEARHRLVLLHHHVVPLPHGVGKGPPTEIGMRLDDARTVAEAFDEAGVHFVMHGHRHVSEQRQPAGSRFHILASPSLTLGCRSGDEPSYWKLELADRRHVERVYVPLHAISQQGDPDEEAATVDESD
jgi:3',5'-cyclic AMP phosphodiesterase CpdA